MAKGPSKANLILNEARQRLSVAQQNVETAEGQLGIARAALNAHQMAYDALEKALTPKPRKKPAQSQSTLATPSTTANTKAPKADSNGALCVAQVPGLDVPCGNREDNGIHDPSGGYGGYHPFVPAVPAVAKKLSRKGAAASSTQSSEVGSGAAMSASGD